MFALAGARTMVPCVLSLPGTMPSLCAQTRPPSRSGYKFTFMLGQKRFEIALSVKNFRRLVRLLSVCVCVCVCVCQLCLCVCFFFFFFFLGGGVPLTIYLYNTHKGDQKTGLVVVFPIHFLFWSQILRSRL